MRQVCPLFTKDFLFSIIYNVRVCLIEVNYEYNEVRWNFIP